MRVKRSTTLSYYCAMYYLVGLFVILVGALVAFLISIHLIFRVPRTVERGSPGDLGLDYREVRIPTVRGKRLYAWWLPGGAAAATVIVLHGWRGNAELMLPMALPFYRAGMNVLLVDARNHGRSDSDGFSSMPRFAVDVGRATDWLKAQSGGDGTIVLLGHSVGAGAVLLEASRRDDITAVISVAAFAHPEWMMRRYLRCRRFPDVLISGGLRYVEWVIGHPFDEVAPMNTACKVRAPVLLVHGGRDATVPVADAYAIRDHCPDRALRLLVIPDAGHGRVEQVEAHGRELLDFLSAAGIVGPRDPVPV
jgi:pimeloyl-ACP methyl ester carboxylesterase